MARTVGRAYAIAIAITITPTTVHGAHSPVLQLRDEEMAIGGPQATASVRQVSMTAGRRWSPESTECYRAVTATTVPPLISHQSSVIRWYKPYKHSSKPRAHACGTAAQRSSRLKSLWPFGVIHSERYSAGAMGRSLGFVLWMCDEMMEMARHSNLARHTCSVLHRYIAYAHHTLHSKRRSVRAALSSSQCRWSPSLNQEISRGGRDGDLCQCHMLASHGDKLRLYDLIENTDNKSSTDDDMPRHK